MSETAKTLTLYLKITPFSNFINSSGDNQNNSFKFSYLEIISYFEGELIH